MADELDGVEYDSRRRVVQVMCRSWDSCMIAELYLQDRLRDGDQLFNSSDSRSIGLSKQGVVFLRMRGVEPRSMAFPEGSTASKMQSRCLQDIRGKGSSAPHGKRMLGNHGGRVR